MKTLFTNLKGDAFGGITAGIVALPLALAFGVSSGLGPSAGLYGAIFLGFFAALLGGTSTQISGPTAPMTAVSMILIAGILQSHDGNIDKALPIILSVFIIAGLFQVLIGAIGLGKYIKYIPYPVVSGFMTAIGLIIIITNILPILGYYVENDQARIQQFKPQAEELIIENILKEEAEEGLLVLEDFRETIIRAERITEEEIMNEAKILANKENSGVVGAIKSLPRALRSINYMELILALVTIIIIYGFKKITTKIPSTLVALLLVSGVAIVGGLDYRPIEKIPSGFPMINFDIFTKFEVGSLSPYIFTAITLAFLGAIDSLLTSVVADNMTKTSHKPNRELIGQGIGNSIAGLFGGLPGAGATIRTVVNINAGGKTKLSGMIAGLFLLVILLAIGPLASKIPAAVLAGILMTVGIGVMDYKGLKAVPSMPSAEVLVMIVVLLLSTFWNLVYAVGVGLIIASLVFMKKMGDSTEDKSDVKTLKAETSWKDESNFTEEMKEKVFIKHIKGPIFFGSTSFVQVLAKQIPASATHVIIRMDRVPYIDQTGLFVLEDVMLELEKNDIHILLVDVQKQPLYLMKSIDIIPDLVSDDRIFDSFEECTKWISKNILLT
ncbi:SulP family inorganic anion transporter [Lutimonas halocynthiae]|uniref:SulP family inorganic anion transporter n=1 Tax=Lutimonas halocynthiae TaxID=1446477 RepID=UPI0025B479F7|nr:SulP family inorganic anion transporter [Lutimonas halocynthiae]MDN3644378.1 SulP family inorganic anion transporter [Lutimonas halocynthiae]